MRFLVAAFAFAVCMASFPALSETKIVSSYGVGSEPRGLLERWHVVEVTYDTLLDIDYGIMWFDGEHTLIVGACITDTVLSVSITDKTVFHFRDTIDFGYRVDKNKAVNGKRTWRKEKVELLGETAQAFMFQFLSGNVMRAQVGEGKVFELNLSGTQAAWAHVSELCDERQ